MCLFVCWITSLPLVILILHVMEVVDQWRKINYFVVGSYLPISRVGVCEPAFSRFLFFLSRELTFNKTVEQHQPGLLLIEIIPMRMLFPAFFFLFVYSFPRRGLSVRFGARSQICGDSRTVRFSRLLCGLVTVLQKEESSVKRLLSIFYTGEVLQLRWSRSNYKDQPEVRCCLLWHAFWNTLRNSPCLAYWQISMSKVFSY